MERSRPVAFHIEALMEIKLTSFTQEYVCIVGYFILIRQATPALLSVSPPYHHGLSLLFRCSVATCFYLRV
jgi:hypothetical protein